MQTSEIIGDILSKAIAPVKDLEDVVLNGGTATEARRFLGYSSRLLDEWSPEHYNLGNKQLKAAKMALNSAAADMEKAGLPPEKKIINYELLKKFALSHGLGDKVEEYKRIIAGLNGTQY